MRVGEMLGAARSCLNGMFVPCRRFRPVAIVCSELVGGKHDDNTKYYRFPI